MIVCGRLAGISLFVLFVLTTGCTSQALKDFDVARQINTIASYEHFVRKHPDSKYTGDAKEIKEILFWEETKKNNTIQSFDSYLNEHPNGLFNREAKQKKEKIVWEKAKDDNKILSYTSYLDQYPWGKFVDEATQRIDILRGKKRREIIGNTFLTVKAVDIKSGFKERDKYFLYRERHWLGFVDEYIFKYDTGYSGYYPMEQRCSISGRTYRMNDNNVFYQNYITPGTIEIVASFKEGRWDGYNRRQTSGETHRKRFYLKIDKDDNIEVMIFYIFNGLDAGIEVKAARKQERVERGVIGTVYETIEVFY